MSSPACGPDESRRPPARSVCTFWVVPRERLDRERLCGYMSAADYRSLQSCWLEFANIRKKRCYISAFGGEWCNGSTTDSDSVCLGSNPGSPATYNHLKLILSLDTCRLGQSSCCACCAGFLYIFKHSPQLPAIRRNMKRNTARPTRGEFTFSVVNTAETGASGTHRVVVLRSKRQFEDEHATPKNCQTRTQGVERR
jgi:hypothetical protein